MRVELSQPVQERDVLYLGLARDYKKEIEWRNKHGRVEKAKVLSVEWCFAPQGIGNGYFVDLMFEGDDVSVSEYLANKIADAKAGQ